MKEDIFEQAELYLNEIGEFAPFGITSKDDIFKNIGYYDDSQEDVNSLEVMAILKKSISDDINKDIVDYGMIAANTSITVKGVKVDAIMTLLSTNGKDWEDEYYPYTFKNGLLSWGIE